MGSLRPGQDGFGKETFAGKETGPEIEMAERDRAREHDPVRERERLLRKEEGSVASSSSLVVDDRAAPFALGPRAGKATSSAGGAPMPARMPVPLPGSGGGMKGQRRETPTQPYPQHPHPHTHQHTHLAPHPSHPSLGAAQGSTRPPNSHTSPGDIDMAIPPYGGSRQRDEAARESVPGAVPANAVLPPLFNNAPGASAGRESSRGPPTAPRRDREQPPTAPRRERERDAVLRERERDPRDREALPRDRDRDRAMREGC